MYTLMFEDSFSAAHSISGYKGNCERLHGHNYKVRVYIRSNKLNRLGMVCDFKEINKKLKKVILPFNHQNLNTIPPFDKISPTCEHIAYYIFKSLKETLPELYEVRVYEKDGAWAGYKED